MGKIQDLYRDSVRPMLPSERLQLARMILNDLAPSDQPVDISDEWSDEDLADVAVASVRRAEQSESRKGAGDESR